MIVVIKPFSIAIRMGASKGLEDMEEGPFEGLLTDKIELDLAHNIVSRVK